jgi:predicted acylesterase/phospholipase RssA/CRP-like cAMP-binding protein
MIEKPIPQEKLSDIVTFLSKIELFKTLNHHSLEYLTDSMVLVSIGGGETLIHQGEVDTSFYIVLQGRLRVYVKQRGQSKTSKEESIPVAEISVGQMVGEIALLTQEPRTGTVRAIRDSLLLKLDKLTFDQFEQQHPYEVAQIAKTSLKRLITKSRPTEPGENTRTFTIAPAGDSDHRPFTHRFVAELNKIKPTLLVTSKLCNEHFGKDVAQTQSTDITNYLINNWLHSLENEYGYIVYETDVSMTPWTQRCLRQSDRIVLVADTHALDTNPNFIETNLFSIKSETLPYIELICLHSEETTIIRGTNRWFKNRPFHKYHHLKMNVESFARYIRFLNGQAFGLVLNGGGARGFTHIGVIRALEELNQPIDFVGGCSMGALIGGYYASGTSAKEMIESTKDYVEHLRRDYTLPLVSLLKGKYTTEFFQRIYGDKRIEDLWTPFFCISSNVTHAKLHVYDEGPLWLAIRVTTSMPGIYPPIYDDQGNMHVDGGIVNNMPVDIMRKAICGGKILAVNCHANLSEPTKSLKERPPWISGWKLFIERFNPITKEKNKFDNIYEIVASSLMVCSNDRQEQMEREADYLLQFDTSKYSIFQFEAADELLHLGYRLAMEKLPHLLK